MVSVSLCMIVKNEELILARCLNSVKDLVDEIIIVDTGSVDGTIKIAEQFTEKVYEFEWIDDFSAARNFSFSKATKEYIFWLDADDVLFPEDQEKFLKLKSRLDSGVDTVRMVYVLNRDAQGRMINSLHRNRLVKASRNFRWSGAVHELLHVSGKSITTDICVSHLSVKSHKTDRNLKIYEALLENGEELSPRDQFYYANECFEHGMYERAIKFYRCFLNTKRGWAEDCIRACDLAAESFLQLEKVTEAENILYESFLYDSPRANICCKLGYIYLYIKKNYRQAIYWYTAVRYGLRESYRSIDK